MTTGSFIEESCIQYLPLFLNISFSLSSTITKTALIPPLLNPRLVCMRDKVLCPRPVPIHSYSPRDLAMPVRVKSKFCCWNYLLWQAGLAESETPQPHYQRSLGRFVR